MTRLQLAASIATCIVMVLVAAVPFAIADTHDVVKGGKAPRASAIIWEFVPPDFGNWSGHIVNNGLSWLTVEVYDNTTGVMDEVMHEWIRFAPLGAYPHGEVNTSKVLMSPSHKYTIIAIPNGPKGASCAIDDVFVSPPPPSKTTTIYDMFEQPWGDWWPWRYPHFKTDIILSNVSGQYTMLFNPDKIGRQGIIYAPYRMNINAINLRDLSVNSPEFMPVLGTPNVIGAGGTVDVYFQYLDTDWWDRYWKPVWDMPDEVMETQLTDGWYSGVEYSVTMNRAAAEEWLGMPQNITDPMYWWAANGEDYVQKWTDWIMYEGNVRLDIWSAYEWPFVDIVTKMQLTELPDGRISLRIGALVEGYEILMTRWLTETGLCTHEPYYEDMSIHAVYSSSMANFMFDAACQYSLHAVRANESFNGSAWVWDPNAIDYMPSWDTPGGAHPSRYDPYAGLRYTSWNAGDPMFGKEVRYENTPTWYNLENHSALVFRLPTGDNVIGYVGTGVPSDAIRRIILYKDYSAYDNITVHGAMSLGYYAVSSHGTGGPDLAAMYDSSSNTLTIEGPAYFDNARHPTGELYHGAPWIEFNVTPEDNVPSLPVASFTYALDGMTVAVDASGSSAGAGIASYTWDWGDGTVPDVTTSTTTSHTYGVSQGTVPAPPPGGPPWPPIIFYGFTYDSNGSGLLPGCTVTITNKRTGEFLTSVSDGNGFYGVDVGYLPWFTGDKIEVTAIKGAMFGSNWGIYLMPYLQLDVTLRMPGPQLITLTVTDTLSQTGTTTQIVVLA